jgi:hypothetical protein
MAHPQTQPLFARHPVTATVSLASGQRVPTPFHCYDADACIVIGSVDLAAAAALVGPEGAHPVELSDGRGVAALWVMDYKDTCVGPYTELVLTLAVRTQPSRVGSGGRYARAAVFLDPQNRLFIHRLLLPRAAAVAIDYGRELIHLDKLAVDRIDVTRVSVGRGVTEKRFAAVEGERTALRGRLREDNGLGALATAALGLVREAGLARTLGALGTVGIDGQAPERLGGGLIRGHLRGRARLSAFAPGDELVWDRATVFGRDLDELGYRPLLVQRVPHCQFVMYPAIDAALYAAVA